MAYSKRSSSNCSCNFPEELIIEILSRLPASSLVEFKLVCKAWHLLIKSPKFISMHLKQSENNPKLSSMLILSDKDSENEWAMFTYSENSLNKLMSPLFPFMGKTDHINCIGVSGGLICICWDIVSLKFLICNPVTRKLHRIPDLERLDKYPIDTDEASFGFGFDPSSNDYKLIMVMPFEQNQIAIYSMSTNSWRRIDAEVFVNVFVLETIAFGTIGGVFYWEGTTRKDDDDDDDDNDDVLIWSFGMHDEVNRVIEGPECYQGMGNDLKLECLQLNQELAMFVRTSERCYKVWVLNKEGTSWSEKFRIEQFPIIERHVHVQRADEISVVGCSENGNVIVIDKRVRNDIKLCSYNLTSKEFKVLTFPHRMYYDHLVFWYTETLLPAKKNNQV